MKTLKKEGESMNIEGGVTENVKRNVINLITQNSFAGKKALGAGFFVIKKSDYTDSDEMIIDEIDVDGKKYLILHNLG